MLKLTSSKCKLEGKKLIAIVSSKGGVGKSTIATLLAKIISEVYGRVCIFDLDIHNSSIPRLLNIDNIFVEVDKLGFKPIVIGNVEVVSLLNIASKVDIVPGYLKKGILCSLITYSNISSNYIIFDLPPGLSDELLTLLDVCSKVDVVLVSTYSKSSLEVIKNVLEVLSRFNNVNVTSLIVNMAYIECCGQKVRLFGSNVKVVNDIANTYKLSVIELPFDPNLENYITTGKLLEYNGPIVQVLRSNLAKILIL